MNIILLVWVACAIAMPPIARGQEDLREVLRVLDNASKAARNDHERAQIVRLYCRLAEFDSAGRVAASMSIIPSETINEMAVLVDGDTDGIESIRQLLETDEFSEREAVDVWATIAYHGGFEEARAAIVVMRDDNARAIGLYRLAAVAERPKRKYWFDLAASVRAPSDMTEGATPDVLVTMCAAQAATGNDVEAKRIFNQMANDTDLQVEAEDLQEAAEAMARSGRATLAAKLLGRVPSRHHSALRGFIEGLIRDRQFELARDVVDSSFRGDPTVRDELQQQLATGLMQSGQLSTARAVLDKVSNWNFRSAGEFEYAVALRERGRLKASAEALRLWRETSARLVAGRHGTKPGSSLWRGQTERIVSTAWLGAAYVRCGTRGEGLSLIESAVKDASMAIQGDPALVGQLEGVFLAGNVIHASVAAGDSQSAMAGAELMVNALSLTHKGPVLGLMAAHVQFDLIASALVRFDELERVEEFAERGVAPASVAYFIARSRTLGEAQSWCSRNVAASELQQCRISIVAGALDRIRSR